jgi:hypothetical protein
MFSLIKRQGARHKSLNVKQQDYFKATKHIMNNEIVRKVRYSQQVAVDIDLLKEQGGYSDWEDKI